MLVGARCRSLGCPFVHGAGLAVDCDHLANQCADGSGSRADDARKTDLAADERGVRGGRGARVAGGLGAVDRAPGDLECLLDPP